LEDKMKGLRDLIFSNFWINNAYMSLQSNE
jgi:hypothetical protein